MPSLFLPAVQSRMQAVALPSNVKTVAPYSVRHKPAFSVVAKQSRWQTHVCQAGARSESQFDESDYLNASVDAVRLQAPNGPVIYLKINSNGSMLPIYVGDTEARALLSGISHQPAARPTTHDLMRSSISLIGFKVTLARITALVGNAYHARMHLASADDSTASSFDVDARPSDAINMAVRFQAPILVSRDVANKMAVAPEDLLNNARIGGTKTISLSEAHAEIVKSCQEECSMYRDPTVLQQLQLQIAVEAERYEEASQIRDKIDQILQSDRSMSLVAAIKTALENKRYEEAVRLREELRQLRTARSFPTE
jgi:bifunctional DNase/RNase